MNRGSINTGLITVRDLYPTIAEIAALICPGRRQVERRSPIPLTRGDSTTVHGADVVVGWEILAGAVREGNWKPTWVAGHNGSNKWRLQTREAISDTDLLPGTLNAGAYVDALGNYVSTNSVLPEGRVRGAWGDAPE